MIDPAKVRVGDIFRMPSGRLRVVIAIKVGNNRRATPARKTWLTFWIKACSWTGRPYTVYNVGELNQLGWVKTRAKIDLSRRQLTLIKRSMKAAKAQQCPISCCQAKDLP